MTLDFDDGRSGFFETCDGLSAAGVVIVVAWCNVVVGGDGCRAVVICCWIWETNVLRGMVGMKEDRGRPWRGVAMVDSTIATSVSNRKIANIYLGQPGPYCFGIGRTRGLLISS